MLRAREPPSLRAGISSLELGPRTIMAAFGPADPYVTTMWGWQWLAWAPNLHSAQVMCADLLLLTSCHRPGAPW